MQPTWKGDAHTYRLTFYPNPQPSDPSTFKIKYKGRYKVKELQHVKALGVWYQEIDPILSHNNKLVDAKLLGEPQLFH